jgi:hypothetical protein
VAVVVGVAVAVAVGVAVAVAVGLGCAAIQLLAEFAKTLKSIVPHPVA